MSVSIPYVSIRPSCICLYSRYDSDRPRTELQKASEINLKSNKSEGEISRKAERRVKQAIDWLLYLSKEKTFYHNKFKRNYKFRINFVTLTLPASQEHSDQEIKKECLNHILVVMRKKWNVQNYVWRAEPQRNGNIHFHIVTDQYIPWNELRNAWNKCVGKLGYVERFHKKFNHKTPNSTDVHAIHKIKNIAAYLSKYCTKNNPGRPINGKLWGLSQGLSRIKSAIDMRWSTLNDEIIEIFDHFKSKVIKSDYVTILYVSVKEWSNVIKGSLFNMFMEYLEWFRSGAPPPENEQPEFEIETVKESFTYIRPNQIIQTKLF